MKNRIVQALLIFILTLGLWNVSYSPTQLVVGTPTVEIPIKEELTIEKSNVVIVQEENDINLDRLEMVGETEVLSEPLVYPDSYYDPETETYKEEEFWDDMELVALVCVSEAGGESEYGKRLVIDTIFNRAESEWFPNTIHDVVYAPGQYECVTNGRINTVEYDEYIANLVLEELQNRTNKKVIYFRTEHFFNFGTPLFQEGHHYFSGR